MILQYLLVGLSILGVVFFISLIGFVKVPENEIAFISGFRKRMIRGRIGFFLRYFERVDRLDLSMISIDVRTSRAIPTKDYININVDAVVNVQVDSKTDEGILLAATNFLNSTQEEVTEKITPLLEGNLREIIGMSKLTELVENRTKFNEDVTNNIVPDLGKLGLKILQFNVQNFNDDKGIIEDLGIENTVAISKQAKLARAEADKEVKIKEAETLREAQIAEYRNRKEAEEIRIKNEQEIAEKENELLIKKAELKIEADSKQAQADMTYEIEKQIKRKALEQAEGESNLMRQQKEIETTKARMEAEIKITNEIKADTELYQRTKEAEARAIEEKKKAEAERYRQEQEAQAKLFKEEQEAKAIQLKADAQLISDRNFAEGNKSKLLAEAEGIREKGIAEAEGIRQKALAEAEGLDKKAEAMKKYGEAAISEMYFKALPEIAKNVASPLSGIDRITMYGEGNISKLVSDITQNMSKVMDGVSDATGINIKEKIRNFSEFSKKADGKDESSYEIEEKE